MPTLMLSNPLGADDAQEMGLTPREFAVGEVITVDDYIFATLIRTGYGKPYGTDEQILLVGNGDPTEATGVDGQWYLDLQAEVLWGPKVGGYWPSDPIRPDRGVQQLRLDPDYHLRVTYSTGTVVDLGNIRGEAGPEAPLADAATPGRVQLAGDLAGTATAPTVPGLAEIANRIPLAQKGAAGGVATLDGGGLIPSAQLPPLAITNTFPVANQAEMLALSAEPGDVAIRADGAGTFILRAEPASILGNWSALATPVTVASVDGRTGVVSLADLYVAITSKGVAGGVASLGGDGKVPAAQLPASTGGGGDAGFVLATPTADPNVPLDLSIASKWGITDAGATYYDDAGAPAAEAGLLVPDPETGSVAVWRPGAPYTSALGTRVAQLIDDPTSPLTVLGRDRGSGTALPADNLHRGDVYYHQGLTCLMQWNGAMWRQAQVSLIANAAARTAISTTYTAATGLHSGFRVLEADTDRQYTWSTATSSWLYAGGGSIPMFAMPFDTTKGNNYDAAGTGAGFSLCRYGKDASGVVHFAGLMKPVVDVLPGTGIDVVPAGGLPVGYRPNGGVTTGANSGSEMAAVTNSGVVVGRIDIFPNGGVRYTNNTAATYAAGSFVPLGGIKFPTA